MYHQVYYVFGYCVHCVPSDTLFIDAGKLTNPAIVGNVCNLLVMSVDKERKH